MRRRTAAQELLNGLNKYGLPVERLVNPYVLEFDAGEILCLDGEPVEWLFFLLEGRAKIFMTADTGENLILNLWDGYGVLCDMELFMGDGIYHASCRAITPVRGIALPLDVNREILLGCNEYLRRTCRSFARSMAKDRNVFNNILYPVEARLCSYIAMNGTEGEWSDNLTQVSELLGSATAIFCARCGACAPRGSSGGRREATWWRTRGRSRPTTRASSPWRRHEGAGAPPPGKNLRKSHFPVAKSGKMSILKERRAPVRPL